jgi:hypothetical protein
MTEEEREEMLKRFEKALDRIIDNIPSGIIYEQPGYQLTGEIIPEELREDREEAGETEG